MGGVEIPKQTRAKNHDFLLRAKMRRAVKTERSGRKKLKIRFDSY